MAASGYEKWDSRLDLVVNANSPGVTTRWVVSGTTDELGVYTWLASNISLIYRNTLVITEVSTGGQGGSVWFPEIKYGPVSKDGFGKPDGTPLDAQGVPETPPAEPSRPQPNEKLGPEFSIQIQPQTVHRMTAIRKTAQHSADPDVTPPDPKLVIGLTEEGVTGVDIEEGVMVVRETRKLEGITREYVRTLTEMVGTVCDDNGFWGWDRREVKFMGADIQIADSKEVTATYELHFRETERDIEIGDITVDVKPGWDLLDVVYAKTVDENTRMSVPEFAYVWQVYRMTDFSKLGIGR